MRYIIVSFLLLFSAFSNADDKRFIQVSGTGIIEAMPDYLQLNLSIQAIEKNLKKAKQTVDKAMKKLLQQTAKLNIAEQDIDAAHISNQPQYEWRNNTREYRGEQVSRNVSIILRDKEQYAELAHQLLMIKEVQIYGSELKFNDRQALKNQALVKAVQAAKNKALLMAQASGNKLGEVVSIQEQGSHTPQPVYAMARMEKMSMDSEPAPMLIQKQKIQAMVISRYQISD